MIQNEGGTRPQCAQKPGPKTAAWWLLSHRLQIAVARSKEGRYYVQKPLTIASRILSVAVGSGSTASGRVVGVQLKVGSLPARGIASVASLTTSL